MVKCSIDKIYDGVMLILKALEFDNKLMIAGNGGSAADAQHIAAELVGRFRKDRRGLPAIALTTDTSIITSIGNDYSFDNIFSRQVEAIGRKGDVLLAISTSGNSVNIVNAVKLAMSIGMNTVGLTGESGGRLRGLVDVLVDVPSCDTARVQEMHITIGHVMCEIIESALLGS